MAVTSKALTIVGSLLLLHAVYSAYEHSLALVSISTNLAYKPPSPSTYPDSHTNNPNTSSSSASSSHASYNEGTDTDISSSSSSSALPLDIVVETLFSIALLCAAVVLSAPSLQPIRWHVWAGQIERRGVEQVMEGKASVAMAYRALEERPGFLDIRAKRKEFAEWAKKQG